MKTITIKGLPDDQRELLQWVEAGEEVAISNNGKIIARFVPEKPPQTSSAAENPMESKVDWTTSAAFMRDRTGERVLTAEEAQEILDDSRGKW